MGSVDGSLPCLACCNLNKTSQCVSRICMSFPPFSSLCIWRSKLSHAECTQKNRWSIDHLFLPFPIISLQLHLRARSLRLEWLLQFRHSHAQYPHRALLI